MPRQAPAWLDVFDDNLEVLLHRYMQAYTERLNVPAHHARHEALNAALADLVPALRRAAESYARRATRPDLEARCDTIETRFNAHLVPAALEKPLEIIHHACVQALASHGVRRAELREPVIADLDSLGSAHRFEGTFRRGLIYEGRQY